MEIKKVTIENDSAFIDKAMFNDACKMLGDARDITRIDKTCIPSDGVVYAKISLTYYTYPTYPETEEKQ